MRFGIKNTAVLATLLTMPVDRRLVMVILWWMERFGKLVVTEAWRKSIHKHDLHGLTPLRAIDLRSWIYTDPQVIADIVNTAWVYDPKRPSKQVCVYHKTKKGAFHFHVQVHPNTGMSL